MSTPSTCREFRSRVLRALDGSLPIETVFELEEHLRGCPACHAEHESARELDAALARLTEPPVDRLDLDRAVENVRTAIERETAAPRKRRVPVLRWASIALAASAAAALIVILLRPRETSRVEPPPKFVAEPPLYPPVLPPAPSSVPPSAPIDLARLTHAREEVRCVLAHSASLLPPPGDPSPAVELAVSFDDGVRDLSRARWPVLRLVEGAVDDPDPAVARAALRVLGQRGDRLSIRVLESSLSRSDSAVDAALALCDSGEAGLASLAPALRDPRARSSVLERLSAAGSDGAARLVEGSLRETAKAIREPHASARYLEEIDALSAMGAGAVPSLLRSGSAGILTRATTVDALARTEGAAEILGGLVLSRPRDVDDALVLEAIAALQPTGVLPILERRCDELREHRAEALACLASFGGSDTLASLVRLAAGGRIQREEIEGPLFAVLARDPRAGRSVVEELALSRRPVEIQVFKSMLVDRADPACASSLVAIGACELSTSSDRRWAVLLAGEIGGPADAEAIADLFSRLAPSEKELRAACLLAVRAIAGPARAARMLDGFPPRTAARVLTLLARGDSKPTSTVSKLARELGSAHDSLAP